MDDSIQVIIYIVFLAIYFLSRVLKGNKQKAPRPRRSERERDYEEEGGSDKEVDQPMTFEDLLREFTQPKEKSQRPAREASKPVKRDYEFKDELPDDDEIEEVYRESQKKAKEVKTINETVELGEGSIKFQEYQEVDEENEFANDIREMLKDPEDAKKAIILKEILDRKF